MGAAPHSHDVELGAALDFLNTLEFSRGEPLEHLDTADDAVAWLSERGVAHREAIEGRSDPELLARVHGVRAALREIAVAATEHRRPHAASISEVNRVLRARELPRLVRAGDGLRLEHRHVGDHLDDALARLAEPLLREVAEGRPERLRACANESCRWIFYDETPAARRRWCDMSSCGNRAKAARQRARMKGPEWRDPRADAQAASAG